jgi:hypothetical protein
VDDDPAVEGRQLPYEVHHEGHLLLLFYRVASHYPHYLVIGLVRHNGVEQLCEEFFHHSRKSISTVILHLYEGIAFPHLGKLLDYLLLFFNRPRFSEYSLKL